VIEYILGEYSDTPEGGLMKNIRATVAEYERLKIAERYSRGRRLKVKAGSVVTHGKAPFGYRLSKKDSQTILEVYEPEARVVRLIYTWYTIGDGEVGPLTLAPIAERLTQMSIPISYEQTGDLRFMRV